MSDILTSFYQDAQEDFNNRLPGISFTSLVPPAREHLSFQIYLYSDLMDKDLEVLELSNRSINTLHRAGYRTIGELLKDVRNSADLKGIRNCGDKSLNEITGRLFMYHYSLIPVERRDKYIRNLLIMNNVDVSTERNEQLIGR